jgi:hypothetical protein
MKNRSGVLWTGENLTLEESDEKSFWELYIEGIEYL